MHLSEAGGDTHVDERKSMVISLCSMKVNAECMKE